MSGGNGTSTALYITRWDNYPNLEPGMNQVLDRLIKGGYVRRVDHPEGHDGPFDIEIVNTSFSQDAYNQALCGQGPLYEDLMKQMQQEPSSGLEGKTRAVSPVYLWEGAGMTATEWAALPRGEQSRISMLTSAGYMQREEFPDGSFNYQLTDPNFSPEEYMQAIGQRQGALYTELVRIIKEKSAGVEPTQYGTPRPASGSDLEGRVQAEVIPAGAARQVQEQTYVETVQSNQPGRGAAFAQGLAQLGAMIFTRDGREAAAEYFQGLGTRARVGNQLQRVSELPELVAIYERNPMLGEMLKERAIARLEQLHRESGYQLPHDYQNLNASQALIALPGPDAINIIAEVSGDLGALPAAIQITTDQAGKQLKNAAELKAMTLGGQQYLDLTRDMTALRPQLEQRNAEMQQFVPVYTNSLQLAAQVAAAKRAGIAYAVVYNIAKVPTEGILAGLVDGVFQGIEKIKTTASQHSDIAFGMLVGAGTYYVLPEIGVMMYVTSPLEAGAAALIGGVTFPIGKELIKKAAPGLSQLEKIAEEHPVVVTGALMAPVIYSFAPKVSEMFTYAPTWEGALGAAAVGAVVLPLVQGLILKLYDEASDRIGFLPTRQAHADALSGRSRTASRPAASSPPPAHHPPAHEEQEPAFRSVHTPGGGSGGPSQVRRPGGRK